MRDLELAVGVVLMSFYFVLLGFAQWWIYHDAARRGKPPWRVFWVSIFLWPLGHLCWWAFRPEVIHLSADISDLEDDDKFAETTAPSPSHAPSTQIRRL